ncbi:MAG: transcriptional repressor [Dehalococcoidia bacterium]|nr:transcriptional repressor [Dehalococcoidia bacterium]
MTLLSPIDGLVDKLRDQGFKITHPRYQVIERVADRDANFTAEELAAELAPVGRATVYRTIKLLVDQGLLCRVVLGDGSICYRSSHLAHHHHLVCLSCGATEDVHLSDVEAVIDRVRGATSYEVVSHRIEVYGFCPRCKGFQSEADITHLHLH